VSTTLIRGGIVVNADGRSRSEILIDGERVVALLPPGAGAADTVIDAVGMVVLPGLVDPHVHVRDPGLTHKEDFRTATMAAVSAGVTTVMVMPFDDPVASDVATLRDKRTYARNRVFADVAMQAAVGPANHHLIEAMGVEGVVSFELIMGADPANGLAVKSESDVLEILETAASARAIVGVSFSLVEYRTARLARMGRRDASAFQQSRSEAGEVIGLTIAASLALESGARIHVRQVSVPRCVEIIRYYQSRGADISFEVTPHNLVLTASDHDASPGPLKVVPPLRPVQDVEAMRDLLYGGELDMIGSDHAPHLLTEKDAGNADIWSAPGGLPGLETLLGSMLALVGPDRLELVALTCSHRPAQRFGLASKGRIAPGFDADLVVIDLGGQELATRTHFYTKAGYQPFRPEQLSGTARYTLLRGRIVADSGVVRDPPLGVIISPDWCCRARSQ
jgi:dihydroorotase